MSLVLQSSGGGSVTIQEPVTASNLTATLPATTGTVQVSGNMPAFSAYYVGASQSVTSATFTKALFDTELFDTNNNFASSRFTPTVAGYYQINGSLSVGGTITRFIVTIFKNGTQYIRGIDIPVNASIGCGSASALMYFNGTTDYVEMYVYMTGTSLAIGSEDTLTQFSGALVRSA